MKTILDRLRGGKTQPPLDHGIAAHPHLELFYWKSKQGVNFGDYLSSVIVTKIAVDRGYFLDEQLTKQKRLLAIGSVLHFARNNDIIWGSGVNGKVDPKLHTFKQLDVRAVRGPLTRRYLMQRGIDVPEIYGDPALLLPKLLTTRFKRNPETAQGTWIVPNLHDLPLMTKAQNVISPLQPWWKVVKQIIAAEYIISSSLHGLILADAFGVPCRYLRISETESMLKYEDYALGVGREKLQYATSINSAMNMGPMPLVHADTGNLLNAFPFDIWEN